MQELLEELHLTHQSQNAHGTVYAEPSETTSRLPVTIQERNPIGSGARGEQSLQGMSHTVPRNLGTAALHRGGRDIPLHNPRRYYPGCDIINLTSVVSPPPQVPSKKTQFFEVCINTGSNAVRLREIDLALVASDGDLFNEIWDRYRQTRGYGMRAIFLKPRDVHFVMVSSQG